MTDENRQSLADVTYAGEALGLEVAYNGGVVSAAAVIMISVFILMDMAFIKTMGFALAAAVFFDAFVVRMVIMPSLIYLIGDKAWWLPRLTRPPPRTRRAFRTSRPRAMCAERSCRLCRWVRGARTGRAAQRPV